MQTSSKERSGNYSNLAPVNLRTWWRYVNSRYLLITQISFVASLAHVIVMQKHKPYFLGSLGLLCVPVIAINIIRDTRTTLGYVEIEIPHRTTGPLHTKNDLSNSAESLSFLSVFCLIFSLNTHKKDIFFC